MGLFNSNNNKKKPAAPVSAAPAAKPIDPEDIWNTPSPRRKQTVTVKESKYDDAVPEKLEVESVDPEMIKTKMAQLEAELSAAASGTDISRHRRRGAVKEGGAADNRRRLRARIPCGSSCAGAVFGRDS